MATTTIGHLKTRNAFITQGQGVVKTSNAERVAVVSARETRNRALRTPCEVMVNPWNSNRENPGVKKIAGAAMAPVNKSTGPQIHVPSLNKLTLESAASSKAHPNMHAMTTKRRDAATATISPRSP